MKLNKKIFYIFIFFLLILSFLNVNSNAANISSNGIVYNIPDDIKNFIIADFYDTNCIVLIFSENLDSTWKITQLNSTYNTTSIINSSGSFKIIRITKGQTDFNSGSVEVWNKNITVYQNIIYSSKDIYNINGSDVFFQVPVQGVVVPALGEAKELPKAIVETLKIIIPVGLVILGIGFLIYLIKSVILRVI